MCLGSFGGRFNLFVTGFRASVTDVIPYRTRKQDGLLGHAPDLGKQAVLADLPDIHPIYQYPASGHIIEAWDEIDQGRFTRTGGAQNGDGLPGFGSQVDGLEDGFVPVAVIVKVHIFENNPAGGVYG